jgi:hypothetical protein
MNQRKMTNELRWAKFWSNVRRFNGLVFIWDTNSDKSLVITYGKIAPPSLCQWNDERSPAFLRQLVDDIDL